MEAILLVLSGLAGLITWLIIPFFIVIAPHIGLVDTPDGTIKRHTRATPYLGGLAVGCGVGIAFCLSPCLYSAFLTKVMIGAYLALLVGLADDMYVLKYYNKFFWQCFIAMVLVANGVYAYDIAYFKGTFGIQFFSAVWIVSLMNAFNLIDVMDGLTATTSIGCATMIMSIALRAGCYAIGMVMGFLNGALLAFLWYNRPIARIYLGDAGSLFLGCLFAGVSLIMPWGSYIKHGWLLPLVIFAIPLIELVSLIVIRTYKGIPFYKASPDHFCLYLRRNGWSIPLILGYVMLISLVLATTALLFVSSYLTWYTLIGLGCIYLSIWICIILKPF